MALAIKLGCDPEFFIKDKGTNEIRSAYGLLPGTKKDPYPVKNGAVQIDGTATEFNIDPATTEDEFNNNIASVITQMSGMLPLWAELTDLPTAMYDPAYFAKLPAAAVEMGCEPDLNAYTGKENVKPVTELPMRTAGGHVHIGWTEGKDIHDPDHIADCIEVVKQIDVYLGVPSLMWDNDFQRRQLYGKAGSFRVKSYGVEYRPMSCVWAFHEPLRRFVFEAATGAIRDLYQGVAGRKIFGDVWAKNVIDRTKWSNYGIDDLNAGSYISSYHEYFPTFRELNLRDFTKTCREVRQSRVLNKPAMGAPVVKNVANPGPRPGNIAWAPIDVRAGWAEEVEF